VPSLRVNLDGDNAWPDLADKMDQVLHLRDPDWTLVALPGGMTSGSTSVALRINLPDGQVVICETSLAIWLASARALAGRYGWGD
jgi:hypothetical protein